MGISKLIKQNIVLKVFSFVWRTLYGKEITFSSPQELTQILSRPRSSEGISVTQVDGDVYVNGDLFVTGTKGGDISILKLTYD